MPRPLSCSVTRFIAIRSPASRGSTDPGSPASLVALIAAKQYFLLMNACLSRPQA